MSELTPLLLQQNAWLADLTKAMEMSLEKQQEAAKMEASLQMARLEKQKAAAEPRVEVADAWKRSEPVSSLEMSAVMQQVRDLVEVRGARGGLPSMVTHSLVCVCVGKQGAEGAGGAAAEGAGRGAHQARAAGGDLPAVALLNCCGCSRRSRPRVPPSSIFAECSLFLFLYV